MKTRATPREWRRSNAGAIPIPRCGVVHRNTGSRRFVPIGQWRNLPRSYYLLRLILRTSWRRSLPQNRPGLRLRSGPRRRTYQIILALFSKTSSITNNARYLSNGDCSAISNIPTSSPITSNATGPVRDVRLDVLSNFIAAYKSLRKSLTVRGQSLIHEYAALMGTAIVGVASTYNPYRVGVGSDEMQTASGELYDTVAWTAAIRIDLREQFRGVHYGKNYQPAFALVESGEKKVIVKINDVGPLKPGRVIDLNERSMRYFDPTLQLGLISDVKVALLPGEDWTPGPIGSEQRINLAIAQ